MSEFYDIVDSGGNVVETAAEQAAQLEAASAVVTLPEEIPLERKPDPPSSGEMKILRKQYVTVKLPRVIACQHRLDLGRQPRMRNCESCIFAFFQNHGEMVQQLDEMHTSGKDSLIIQLQGKKFYRNWRRFMSTIAQFKQEENVSL